MNHKPVAYMSILIDDDGDKCTMFCGHKDEYIENQIPLYTHPAKTLTDEEIIEIWSGMETDTGEQNIEFARAILRKAQEK